MATDKKTGQQALPLSAGPHDAAFQVWVKLPASIRICIAAQVRAREPLDCVRMALAMAGYGGDIAEQIATYVRECVAD